MRRLWALASLILVPGLRAEAPAPGLRECFHWAVERSETLAEAEESLRSVEAQYRVVRAGWLPELGARGAVRWQDAGGERTSGGAAPRARRSESGLYARQTMFLGLREWAAVKAQSALRAARAHDWVRARQNLLLDVAEVYYTVLDYDRERRALEHLGRLMDERLEELGRRIRIGRSRESERLSVESQRAGLEARLRRAEGLHRSAREVLGVLTGRSIESVASDTDAPAPPSLEECLRRLSDRPDLAAAARDADAAAFRAAMTAREFWPTLSLEGDRYVQRSGSNAAVDWEAAAILEWPLFRGGAGWHGRRADRAIARAAAWRRDARRRAAEAEVRARRSEWESARFETEALSRAAVLAERNYEAQTRDYRLGLVTNLDVLAALDALEEARLAHERRRLDTALAARRLAVAVGDVPEALP